jgi:hypothetical protein
MLLSPGFCDPDAEEPATRIAGVTLVLYTFKVDDVIGISQDPPLKQ